MSEKPVMDNRTGVMPSASASPEVTWKHWVMLFGVALGAILVDQATKAYATAHLTLYESWMPLEFLQPVFKFTLTHNRGVAFGMFGQGSWLFLIIPPIAAAVIVYYYRQFAPRGWLIRLALGLQLAGALGNFFDRIRQGYVVDFLHVTRWPVFNVADSCIVAGVGLLMAIMLYDDWQTSRSERKMPVPEPGDSGQG